MRRLLRVALAPALTLALWATTAGAIGRDEVIVRAKAFAYHPWTCTSANLTASCSSSYESAYVPGDYLGLPYDWGGYMTLFDFDQQIAAGDGAGSYPEDGVLACTAGLDCSGFVSKCWDASHYSTSTLSQISTAIGTAEVKAGDAFNQAGYHVVLFSHTLGNGDPVFYESVGYNVHLSMPGWSWVQGYTPRRYQQIVDTPAASPLGTPDNPIIIGALPFSDARDTTVSKSDVLDGCGADPTIKETGREYVYRLTLTKPGTLTATVQDDAGVDIDVHLYTSMNTSDCIARGDTSIVKSLDCGTYYVVADTFKGTSEHPGPYTLTVDFAAGSGSCGSGPPSYDFAGGLGDPCAYPDDPDLPFCNPNLGATTCIYTASDSFCSKPCTALPDCSELPGGCCGEIGNGEHYCLPASLCGGGTGGAGGAGAGGAPLPVGGSDAGPPPAGGAGGSVPSGGAGGDDGYTATFGPDDDEDESGCVMAPARPRDATGPGLLVLAAALGTARRRLGAPRARARSTKP